MYFEAPYYPTNRLSSNYATAERPRCMLREEFYPYQNQQQPRRRYRKFDYIGDDDYDDDTTWYWNMSHNQPKINGSSVSAGKNSSHSNSSSKGRNATDRTSGFQSFFRWFKKDDKNRNSKDIRYPRELTSSTDTLDYVEQPSSRNPPVQLRKKLRGYTQTPSPKSPRKSYGFSNQSSSCDSIFSTASSFAFVPPIKYLLNKNQRQQQTEKRIFDDPYTESYHKRVKARDRMREIDKKNEITLRKKYHLYAESSDIEANNNNLRLHNHNQPSTSRTAYIDFSLPSQLPQRQSNVPDSVKLEDLQQGHRRTSSDSSKDRKSGAFVHVRNKKKAPLPPLDLRSTNTTPKTSSGRRRKRQAPPPPPPLSPSSKVLEEASSATSLLGDKEIQALIQGTTSLVKNTTTVSSPIIVQNTTESPIMEKKKIYVSPYLKIREDRKLTDEQKRLLLEQVTKNQRRSEEQLSAAQRDRQQFDFPKVTESLKITKDDKDKIFAPSSPISPRPWYKRSTATNGKETIPFKKEVFLRTLDKKKSKKEDKDLPEVGYSRNSFFDTASKFNIFAKLGDDSKKKEREAEKRKSLIGIPNISELDREASEIIQREQEASRNAAYQKLNGTITESTSSTLLEKDESPTTKDLIQKFELNSTQTNRVTLNGDFVGRADLFGKSKFSFDSKDIKEFENTKTKLPAMQHKIESNKKQFQTDGLLGLWKCSHCTLENPNWKIICESCGKIKPYEKRFCVNNESPKKESPLPIRKFSYESPKTNGGAGVEVWDRKSELVKKYFQPQLPRPMDLSKSPSESFIANSHSKKSPSPTRRYMGSPKMLPRKLSVEKPSGETKIAIDAIQEETNESAKDDVIVKTKLVMYPPIKNDHEDKKLTPDLNELRNARLARFNTSLEIKRNQTEIERQNAIATNRKQSPEKKFSEKLDFSDPIALEREKERLRDKIRAMNAKAFTEKYPTQNGKNEEKLSQEKKQLSAPLESPANALTPNESSKLGAIKKVFKKLPEETSEKVEEEKIINKDVKVANSSSSPKDKRDKISISVQTTQDVRPRKKSEDFTLVPMTVVDFDKKERKEDIKIETKLLIDESKFNGNAYNTNTIAINKILRNLENAIADGKHDEAAKLAKDLAKLKVALSVTRQRERPKSDIDLQLSKLKTWLCIKEDYREMEVNCYEVSPNITIDELKKQISKDYYVPVQKQKISINGIDYNGGKSLLKDMEFATKDEIKIYVDVKKNSEVNGTQKNDSESDDEPQNEKVGAVGGLKETVKTAIEEKGWECPLCTLINLPSRAECLACSTYRPKSSPKETPKLKDIAYHLRVNEDLRTFFEMDKVDLRQKQVERNDLDRNSGSRKSSDIFNILVEDKEIVQTLNPIVMTASIANPNITKNKYRGVENFNPFNKSYLFPKTEANDVRKPVITNVIYKSTNQNSTKDILSNNRKSHYQELVNLEISDIVPNLEEFECSICFLKVQPKFGVCLRDCLHTFCRICLENHVKYSEEAEVKCPFIDDVYSCQSLLQDREIRGLVSKDEYEKHLSLSIRLAENKIENAFHCKTPNCKGWCIFEDTTNNFKCPVCTIINCITCGAVHDGLNCKEYQDHLSMDSDAESVAQTKKMLQEMIEKNEAMNCPTCHIFLLKKFGCDWLKCSFCKTEICWITKMPRWGPSGKGDYSAGCKCGLNGKKCSPKCTYCH